MRTNTYFSCDVETDGATPSIHSLVSVGMVVMGTHGKEGFAPADLDATGFYAECKPTSEVWVPEALAISGLTREHLAQNGRDIGEAMRDLARWVEKEAAGTRPVFVAYPASFDWRWVAHSLEVHGGVNPFGFSGVLDLKTLIVAHKRIPLSEASKRRLPRSSRPHTHNALDDAREQGDVGQQLLAAVLA
jgi:DNA polymerase III epsilon subunit-like protein